MVDRQDVTSGNCCLSATENVLARVCSFGSEEVLGLFFVLIWVSEIDLDDGTVSSGVMKHGSDDSPDVSLAFREVEVTISGWGDAFALGGGVDTALFTFPLA